MLPRKGAILEQAGWRQGLFLTEEAARELVGPPPCVEGSWRCIVISQSCDIAQDEASEPEVEVIWARIVPSEKKDLLFGRHPRKIHLTLDVPTGDMQVSRSLVVECFARDKRLLSKEGLCAFQPDADLRLSERQLSGFVRWLAGRYSRPAWPTAFNDRVAAADPKGKLRKRAKSLEKSGAMTGIYLEITPDGELETDQDYNVNMLGLIMPGESVVDSSVRAAFEQYADILRKAGMDVEARIVPEDKVSVATLRRYRRINFDDLSISAGSDLPVELASNL